MTSSSSLQALSLAVSKATPEERRSLYGEALFPHVDKLEHEFAAKIVGMLLELDEVEVMSLLETPRLLKARVGEAKKQLNSVASQVAAHGPGRPVKK